MSPRLPLPDPAAARDVLTFAGRAARLGDGALRLQARGGLLAMTAAPLAPRGLLDATPTVLGMRVIGVDAELECDLVVDAGALGAADDPREIALPDSAVRAAWAGVSPPRSGWDQVGELSAVVLDARAQHGMAAVAHALPVDPGEDVVRTVRAQIWGTPDEDLADLPLGVAFAAQALGFLHGDEPVVLRRSGPWTRLSLQRGHVLVRGPQRTGMTPVRTTGS